MKTLDEIMDRFTGPSILHDLAGLLREHDSEFPDTEKKYHAAVSALRAQLGEAAAPSLDAYLSACRREVIADILYAAYMISAIPPLLLFAFFNKALTSNISLGGIKE